VGPAIAPAVELLQPRALLLYGRRPDLAALGRALQDLNTAKLLGGRSIMHPG
jgi:hypothetical protein